MSRTNGSGRLKKRHGCLTCLIVCFVIMAIFVAALFIGGSILFKSYVSPHIGGVTLTEALSLLGKVLNGKEAVPDYTEEDLDAFYTELSESLFLSEKTEDELEYELLSDEVKASLAESAVSAAEEDAEEEGDASYEEEPAAEDASYDDAAAFDRFCLLSLEERYALLSEELRASLAKSDYGALATEAKKDVRERLGLKMYRISVRSLMDGFTTSDGQFTTDGAVEKVISSLDFNFAMLEDYDIHDPDAAENMRFDSITVKGKGVSAFINDVVEYLLTAPSSPLKNMIGDKIPADTDLTKFVKVASVTIMNTPLATAGNEALFDQKDTALGIVFSLKLRDMANAILASGQLDGTLSSVPSFAMDLIPKLIPKDFSFGATVYPLAASEDGRELAIKINRSTSKHAETISKIMNGLLGSEDAETTFLGTVNEKVVSVFGGINEKVKINFVPSRDENGDPLKDAAGNTYAQMRIMTVETLVSLIDSSGELSAHDVFTVLKCLYVANETHTPLDLDAPVEALKAETRSKYGMDTSFITAESGFSTDTLNGLLDHMDLKSVDFSRGNEEMRVRFSAEALASLMMKVLSAKTSSEDSSDNLLAGLDPGVCEISIKKAEGEEGIYTMEILLTADLAEMIRNKFSSSEEGLASTLLKKILPKQASYFGLKVYLSEYTEDGHVKHLVGQKIAGEGDGSAYASKLRINDFSYEETDNVLSAFNKFMNAFGGSSFDIASVTSSLETSLSDMFSSMTDNSLGLNLRLFGQDDASNGGMLLPSVYELLSDTVKKKGTLGAGETFSPDDAQEVLQLVYSATVDTDENYSASQSDDFLADLNKNYYITYASRLTASLLFGGKNDGGENSLQSKLNSNSIYFKEDASELAAWRALLEDDSYQKPALYTDPTAKIEALRVPLTGSELAALVDVSGSFPKETMASSFGSVGILGAEFITEAGKTYLRFDMLCSFSKSASEGSEGGLNMNALFPDAMNISAKILLFAPSYPAENEEGEHRFDTTLLINGGNSGKIFILLKALGSADLSEKTMSEKLSSSIKDVFVSLEKNIRLYYANGSSAYTITKNGETENCIYLADIFTALIDTLKVKDDEESTTLTDPEDFRTRLLEYGKQLKEDPTESSEAYAAWAEDVGLDLFSSEDKAYVTKNMQDAYFMKEEPDLDDIYSNVGNKFSTIKSTDFYLENDEDEDHNVIIGLYHYKDTPRLLKISAKALGALIDEKESARFAAAVNSGSNMAVSLVSLKINAADPSSIVFESGLKITFGKKDDGTDSYPLMPRYFFVQAVTTETRSLDGYNKTVYSYETEITINGLSEEETEKFFINIKGLMSSVDFSLDKIKASVNDSFKSALANFYNSVNVRYGTFDSSDAAYYGKSIFAEVKKPAAGEGYLTIPNVYAFLNDLLFKDAISNGTIQEDEKPKDTDLQHMLNCIYEDNDVVKDALVQKAADEDGYKLLGLTNFNAANKNIIAYSDTYLAYFLGTLISGQTVNGNISLADALKQVLILRAPKGTDAEDSEILTQRAYWAEKFNVDEEFSMDPTHDYIVATINPNLLGLYNVGGATSNFDNLTPSSIWFTVLIDLDLIDEPEPTDEEEKAIFNAKKARGLLYNMDQVGAHTFEMVLKSAGKNFNAQSVAADLASVINTHLNGLSTGADKEYFAKGDSYLYSASYPYSAPGTDINDALVTKDCIGYMVLAKALF
ncbi:MAG: hypothetical protein J6Y74_05230 [Clostridia bacterium]|nr:hypothetical protein [Clostridia bacterium]